MLENNGVIVLTLKPTKDEMNTMMVLLAMAKHIIHCKACAKKQAEIMNHAQIPADPDLIGN